MLKGKFPHGSPGVVIYEPRHEKTGFLHVQKQTHRSAQLTCISAFVFATQIVKFLLFLNLKFLASIPSSAGAEAGLCLTWSETPKTGFLS